MKLKLLLLITSSLLLSSNIFAYDYNGCEAMDNVEYKCSEILSVEGADSEITDVEICIGSGGLQEGLFLTSENLSANILNWHKRNITNVKKNNKDQLIFKDSNKSITGCILNPGSSCYESETAVFDKKTEELQFDLKFSTSKLFIDGWTHDVSLKLACEKM